MRGGGGGGGGAGVREGRDEGVGAGLGYDDDTDDDDDVCCKGGKGRGGEERGGRKGWRTGVRKPAEGRGWEKGREGREGGKGEAVCLYEALQHQEVTSLFQRSRTPCYVLLQEPTISPEKESTSDTGSF
ncbi:uncharacterized protein [Macrobrachium rosenbergii]|uniref:uncharacterized protein n=1 Tax=Macrobrachium rosenbergii TaxID=79674 RepID=UPI0034D6A422